MEQASRDPDNYFNLRYPFTSLISHDTSARFCMVKPCPKEMKCDVELSSFAIRDAEEYKNFCDRPREERPLPEEVIGVSIQ
ncbi:hypothetical protein HHK36_017304 [Tetracentron sinense]|uniref:Uncharacterized protein n=1 Tax=Tetracentron sinense TaxID=13715 RepID=A0A834Z7W7_TETSI|nr:hypothetical protein HHK36_017304 [Tetracentron sinense]